MKLFAYVSNSRIGQGVVVKSQVFFKDPETVHSIQDPFFFAAAVPYPPVPYRKVEVVNDLVRGPASLQVDSYISYRLDMLAWRPAEDVQDTLKTNTAMKDSHVFRGGGWFFAEVEEDFLFNLRLEAEKQRMPAKPLLPSKWKGGVIVAAVLVSVLALKVVGVL